ncbi:MAG: hypothetical protein GEV08_15880 [Acidimicrobiia bacterium]|nr:hypothetical protein [Acidimicrobiia bacterium]
MATPYQPSTPGGLSVGAAFSYGWAKFSQNAGPMIIVTLLVWAAGIVVNIIGRAFDSVVLQLVFSVIAFIVSQVMTRGLVRSALTVVNGGTPEPGSVFSFDNIGPFLVGAILYGLLVGVGLVLCIIPGLILGALFGFWSFACVEQDLDGVSALKRSLELARSNFGSAFLFGLAYIGVNIVGALLCGIGLLVTIPLSYIAAAHFYRQLSGSPVAP